MPCEISVRFLAFALVAGSVAVGAKSGGYFSASPAILRLEKYGGSFNELCPSAFHVPKSRLPNSLAKAVSAPLVDMMPSDGCPSALFGLRNNLRPAPDLNLDSPEPCVENTTACALGDDGFVFKALPGLTAFGSIIIIDDSRRCSTESRLLNVQKNGPKAVILHSSSGLLPRIPSGSPVSVPVLAVGPGGYRRIKGHGFLRRASIYRPTKSIFDPSILLLFFIAIATYCIGGVLSAKETLKALASPQEVTSAQSTFASIHSIFLPGSPSLLTTSGPSRPTPRVPDELSPAVGAGTEALATTPITLPMVFQMVILMAIFLAMMYLFSSYSFRAALDFYMYFILTPSVLAEFFEPLFKLLIPSEYVRVPLLYTLTVTATMFWVKHIYSPGAWIFQDFVAVVIAIHTLTSMRFPSFETIAWALGLLFVYDVFFVFVTPLLTPDGVSVMEKVALSSGGANMEEHLDGEMHPPTWPVMILVPSTRNPFKMCNIPVFYMLGLGDIFWPGLVPSYGYAYDVRTGAAGHPYFRASVLGYTLGLVMAFAGSYLMQMAQPALLYIVPGVLIPVWSLAKTRREEGNFWSGAPLRP